MSLRRLLDRNPNDAQVARDLAVSLSKLGAYFLRRGDRGDPQLAQGLCRQSSEIAQRLVDQNPNDAQAVRSLGASLDRLGDSHLGRGERGDAEMALASYRQSLEIAQRLMDQNPSDARAARDLSVSLNKLGAFYLRRLERGDAESALRCFRQSLESAQRLVDQNPSDAQAARDLSVSLLNLADLYLGRGEGGDTELAMVSYRRCHEMLQRLVEQNPNDAQAARQLSVSLDRLGNFYLRRRERGDAELGLGSYRQSLEIAQRLVDQNPNDAQAARDLSVSLSNLGDFYMGRGDRGDPELALGSYRRCHETLQRLMEQNPNDAQAARGLSVSLSKLGNLYLRRGERGDAELALESYWQCHQTLQRLVDQNPNDAQSSRDLSVSLNKLGNLYLRRRERGDAELALRSYRRSLEIAQRLVDQNPNDAQAARDLSVSLSNLGDFYMERGDRGDPELALGSYRQSHETLQRLVDQDPNVAQVARDLSLALVRLGDFYLRRRESGDAELALRSFRQSLEIGQRLMDQNPNDAQAARDVMVSHYKLGEVAAQLDDRAMEHTHLAECHRLLRRYRAEGRPLDSEMKAVLEQLDAMFGDAGGYGMEGLPAGGAAPQDAVDWNVGDAKAGAPIPVAVPLRPPPSAEEHGQGIVAAARAALTRGQHEEAVTQLRRLVFPREGLRFDPNSPVEARVLFVEALMHAQNAEGADTYLGQLEDADHPRIPTLRAAMRQWRASLGWKEKLGLKRKPPIPVPPDVGSGVG